MALKYSIFYEFIRNTIESASLKNGEKRVHAEALWGGVQKLKQRIV